VRLAASASKAQREGRVAAVADLRPEVSRLMATEDAAEGVRSLVERRAPVFHGR
jgi:hypothetical protein